MVDRILLVGYGNIGKRHLRLLRDAHGLADIRMLRFLPFDKIPSLANGCFDNLDDALKFSPQMAVIANPAPFHLGPAYALVSIGCHILVEKPISHKTDGVERLISLAEKNKVILQVGYNMRFLSSLRKFKKLIDDSKIGEVLSINCQVGQNLRDWRPDQDYKKSVSANSKLGGGVLLELSHELDYLSWIFGNVCSVNAWLGKQSSLIIDVEDTAMLILQFYGNKKGSAPIASVNLDFTRHDSTRKCTAIGEYGTLKWNGIEGDITYFSHDKKEWKTLFSGTDRHRDCYELQLSHFLECIKDKKNPKVTAYDGLNVMKIVEAIKKSAKHQGKRVTLHNFKKVSSGCL